MWRVVFAGGKTRIDLINNHSLHRQPITLNMIYVFNERMKFKNAIYYGERIALKIANKDGGNDLESAIHFTILLPFKVFKK